MYFEDFLESGQHMLEIRPVLLLVDDNPGNLLVLQGVIADSIPLVTIETACSADEALTWVAKRKFDGILTDVQMPVIDGLELCRRLKADVASADIPIILITSHLSSSTFRAEALAAGANDFISRPIDNVELVARILSMLRTKRNQDRLRTSNTDLAQQVARQTVSLREYKKAVESSLDLVTTISADYRYLMVNESFSQYYCLDRELIIGQHVTAFLSGDTFAREVRPRLDACLQGETLEFERSRNFLELGQRHLLTRYCPLKGEDGRIEGVVAISRDITERKQLEEQLQQSQKMEALGTLAGGIAHDFNNTLAAIFGYAQLSQRHVEPESKLDQNLQQIFLAANRAKDLVKQILSFSHKSTVEKEPLEIHLVVKEAVKFLQASIPKTVLLRECIAAETGTILANPTQIHRVMMNLCTNASQAMQNQGGVIDVRLAPVLVDPTSAASHPDLRPGPYVLLEVKDDGPGMDAPTIKRIFEPFFTSKKLGEGTGMGLSVVHGIVQSCGGAILVESRPNQGATFSVYLPRKLGVTRISPVKPVVLQRGTEHILLVDDESTLVQLGEQLFGSLGYRVTGSTDSREALELFRRTPTEFDLVILDLTMPKLSGENLAREILALRPDIPVIFYTGYPGAMDEERARSIGVKALLIKPLSRAKFATELRRVLDGAVRESAALNVASAPVSANY